MLNIFKMDSSVALLILINYLIQIGGQGMKQNDEAMYLSSWNNLISNSFQVPLPNDMKAACKSSKQVLGSNLQTITLTGVNSASSAQSKCGASSICVVGSGASLIMDSSLNVAALLNLGQVVWNDNTQTSPSQYLCAGYVITSGTGVFNMSLTNKANTGYIYLKDNGITHSSSMQTRAFGSMNSGEGSFPIIDMTGRPITRTWSLLANTVPTGASTITLMHDPVAMGWQVGDRITIAPTKALSLGTAESFTIVSLKSTGNKVFLNTPVGQTFNAQFIQSGNGNNNVAIMSAEVINLSRNIIITGDDFRHIPCDSSLNGPINTMGCACNSAISRSQCTVGLHTASMGVGLVRMQYLRVEKCGQRGIKGKYCLHMHFMNKCPDCLFRGNALEYGHQRGIVVHETHLATVDHNVMSDVRGSAIHLEDGNEMYNNINYNAILCPWPLNSPIYRGCTVPGTDNDQADTVINQSGIWSITAINNIVGNRISNTFNGMFYESGDFPAGLADAAGKLNTFFTPLGRLEGNTFHGHGRFGTYILDLFPKQNCIPDLDNNGYLLPAIQCTAYTKDGYDNGQAIVLSNNLDYGNAFVGGYTIGDLQYNSHTAYENLNNLYWKEAKNFNDGCSAHITDSYFANGNMALPDMGAFIIHNTVFKGGSSLETNHHCNIGVTGVLCMPTYVLSNVQWYSGADTWVTFHAEANNNGGIIVLSPTEALSPTGSGGFFPAGYVSLVSSTWSYLLKLPGNICVSASTVNTLYGSLFSGGILCKKSIRSLKIFTKAPSSPSLTVQIYQGNTLITSVEIRYHQVADTAKRGYAFPVITGTEYHYKLTLTGGQPLDASSIVDFSDAVFGNRWKMPDSITLTVAGTGCNGRIVTSQHDRRWIWADSRNYLPVNAWGNGACASTYSTMPAVTCPTTVPPVTANRCEALCSQPCNNGYCDCGKKQCICNPGYYGLDCSQSTCDKAGCKNGRCTATYLGGTLPVSNMQCICDKGWYGPSCDQNQQVTSSPTIQSESSGTGSTTVVTALGMCPDGVVQCGRCQRCPDQSTCNLCGLSPIFDPVTPPIQIPVQSPVQSPNMQPIISNTPPGVCPDGSTRCAGCQLCPGQVMCNLCNVSPVASPTNPPIEMPVGVPIQINLPVLSPVTTPVQVPVQINLPILMPIVQPVTAPVSKPTMIPVIAPIESSPTLIMIPLPILSPIQLPKLSPIQNPTQVPVQTPVSLPISITNKPPGVCPDGNTRCAGCQLCPDHSMCNTCNSSPVVSPVQTPISVPVSQPVSIRAPTVNSMPLGVCPDGNTRCSECQLCPDHSMCNTCNSSPAIAPIQSPVNIRAPTFNNMPLGVCPDGNTRCSECQLCPDQSKCNTCATIKDDNAAYSSTSNGLSDESTTVTAIKQYYIYIIVAIVLLAILTVSIVFYYRCRRSSPSSFILSEKLDTHTSLSKKYDDMLYVYGGSFKKPIITADAVPTLSPRSKVTTSADTTTLRVRTTSHKKHVPHHNDMNVSNNMNMSNKSGHQQLHASESGKLNLSLDDKWTSHASVLSSKSIKHRHNSTGMNNNTTTSNSRSTSMKHTKHNISHSEESSYNDNSSSNSSSSSSSNAAVNQVSGHVPTTDVHVLSSKQEKDGVVTDRRRRSVKFD